MLCPINIGHIFQCILNIVHLKLKIMPLLLRFQRYKIHALLDKLALRNHGVMVTIHSVASLCWTQWTRRTYKYLQDFVIWFASILNMQKLISIVCHLFILQNYTLPWCSWDWNKKVTKCVIRFFCSSSKEGIGNYIDFDLLDDFSILWWTQQTLWMKSYQ